MVRKLFGIVGIALCGAFVGYAQQDAVSLGEKEYFTQINLWGENQKPILTSNYHVGERIPVGSKVMIVASNAKVVKFTYNGQTFTMQLVPKHTTVKMETVKSRTFGKANPLESDAFKALPEDQQAAIKNGKIVEGMTKESVLMAYGYPPEHKTSTSGNFWTYWYDKFRTQTVTFTDGKVSEITGMR